MLKELKRVSEQVGLKMNLSKTKVLTEEDIKVEMDGNEIEKASEYVYLGHTITMGKQNQTAEITRRIRMTWVAVGKLRNVLRNPEIPINLKRKVFNTCILPVLTYGVETMKLTVHSGNRMRTTQRAIERAMLG
ncbi:uncharacterized protein LOC123674648 [Harmonia axyridis]|uniref:uncharacterized protein LOC123674648 n=1 Tax=Harmonia axyridis TaxID=115357 RepID=UPI001E2784C3|nr:uncharacterized protein LOC123674648 [Harmonia axyridis]